MRRKRLAFWLLNLAARLLWSHRDVLVKTHYHGGLAKIELINNSPDSRKLTADCPICNPQREVKA